MPKLILETERLVIREMSLEDLDFTAAMLADPEVMRYYPKCHTRDEAAAWVQRQMDRYARYGHGLRLVSEKATGQPVGQVGVVVQNVRGVDEKEVGYLIHRPYWRRGFITDAATACRDYALTVLGCDNVIALIGPENVPSQGVARKIGLRPEPGLVQHGGSALGVDWRLGRYPRTKERRALLELVQHISLSALRPTLRTAVASHDMVHNTRRGQRLGVSL